MGPKKLGRPTDNPKDFTMKVRVDKVTVKKLEECAQAMGVSKAEIVRRGIHKIHDGLQEN